MTDVAHWSRSFLEELEAAARGPRPTLWSLGGPSFLYTTAEAAIWIDPYFGGTPTTPCPARTAPRRSRSTPKRSASPTPSSPPTTTSTTATRAP